MGARNTTAAGPGRPREFDVDDAVRDAMGVFQTRGYAGTSLVDLIDGTGLTRGSLYKAFTDKHTLFLAALDRYTTEGTETLRANLGTGAPRDAIRAALLDIARTSARERGKRGCLLVASTTELASKDEQIQERSCRTFARIQDLLAEAIRRGQDSGEIASRRDADALARFLLCVIEGMGVLGKTAPSEAAMADIVEVALEALG